MDTFISVVVSRERKTWPLKQVPVQSSLGAQRGPSDGFGVEIYE